MNKLAISFLITSVIAISLGLDCSNVISKESEGILSWLGRISWTIPVSTGPSGWTLTLYFDQNFTGVGVWEGFVSYNGTQKWAEIVNRNESDAELVAGTNKSMRFRINYMVDIPQPQVISVRFQDIELCN